MNLCYILTLMALFDPRALQNPTPDRFQRTAEAIAQAAQAVGSPYPLIVISWGETQFGRAGVPFGVTDYARTHRGGSITNPLRLRLRGTAGL